MRKNMRKNMRLTYGAEANTDYFEGRFFWGKDGKLYTYSE